MLKAQLNVQYLQITNHLHKIGFLRPQIKTDFFLSVERF